MPKPQNHCVLTFDMDWAPDWCIELCIDICVKHNVCATFFVTHPTALLNAMAREPLFELGIHPNFLPRSSHGDTVEKAMAYTLALVPDATAMRTHALVQSSTILATISEQFPQIETDVSLFLPFQDHLQPMDYYISEKGRRLTRIPYYWEDDVAAMWPEWKWDNSPPPSQGLRVFDFHPMYVGLNMQTMELYRALKASLGSTPLYKATREQCAPYINKGIGDRHFLEGMIRHIGASRFKTISSVVGEYRA